MSTFSKVRTTAVNLQLSIKVSLGDHRQRVTPELVPGRGPDTCASPPVVALEPESGGCTSAKQVGLTVDTNRVELFGAGKTAEVSACQTDRDSGGVGGVEIESGERSGAAESDKDVVFGDVGNAGVAGALAAIGSFSEPRGNGATVGGDFGDGWDAECERYVRVVLCVLCRGDGAEGDASTLLLKLPLYVAQTDTPGRCSIWASWEVEAVERIGSILVLSTVEPEGSRVLGYSKEFVPCTVERETCHLLIAIAIRSDTWDVEVVARIVIDVPDRDSAFPEIGLVEEVSLFVEKCIFRVEIFHIDVVDVRNCTGPKRNGQRGDAARRDGRQRDYGDA